MKQTMSRRTAPSFGATVGATAADLRRFTARRPAVYSRISAPPGSWLLDSAFLPWGGRNQAVLVAQEATTRLLAARMVKGAPNAAQAADFLRDLIASHDVQHVSSDGGAEFVGAPVRALLDKHGVTRYVTEPGNLHSGMKWQTERAVETLRHLMEVYAKVVSPRWDQSVLDAACAYYNGRPHATTGIAPAEMTPYQARVVRAKAWLAGEPYRRLLARYKPGARVLVHRTADPTKTARERAEAEFNHKGRERWGKAVYTVDQRQGNRVRLRDAAGTLLRGTYGPRDLLQLDSHEAAAAAQRALQLAVQIDADIATEVDKRRLVRRLQRSKLHELASAVDRGEGPDVSAPLTTRAARQPQRRRGARQRRPKQRMGEWDEGEQQEDD
jgi:hypothetical protein